MGRNRNINDTATMTKVTINATTATKLVDANSDRISLTITVDNDIYPEEYQRIWIRLKAASVDNAKEGDLLAAGESANMETDNIYTGEISAISDKNDIDIYITEY